MIFELFKELGIITQLASDIYSLLEKHLTTLTIIGLILIYSDIRKIKRLVFSHELKINNKESEVKKKRFEDIAKQLENAMLLFSQKLKDYMIIDNKIRNFEGLAIADIQKEVLRIVAKSKEILENDLREQGYYESEINALKHGAEVSTSTYTAKAIQDICLIANTFQGKNAEHKRTLEIMIDSYTAKSFSIAQKTFENEYFKGI